MKRGAQLFLVGIILSIFITGCRSQVLEPDINNTQPVGQLVLDYAYNTAFEKYAEEQVLGIIINEPTSDLLESFAHLETYKHSEEGERLLIVPKYNGSTVTAQRVQFEDEEFVIKETLYSKEQTEDNYGLMLETIRPEGIPELMLTITANGKSIEYLVAYNGKDSTPPIEYLELEEQEESQEAKEVQIIPFIDDGTYLEGYNLLDRREVDIDQDEVMESLELYCTAGYNEAGELLMDDGERWILLVSKDGQLYPVIEPSFIQLGHLEYKIYNDYEGENSFHVLVSEVQGAGLILRDCYYDKKSNSFISKVVYQTTGNIGFTEEYH